MADPNFATSMGMIAKVAKLLSDLEDYTSTSSTGLLANVEASLNALEGVFAQNARDGLISALYEVNGPLTRSGARRVIDPLLRQVAVAIGFVGAADAPIPDVFEAIYDYMIANSQTINDGDDWIAFSSLGTVTGTGNGTAVVCTQDENGVRLGWVTDAGGWTLKCVADARNLGDVGVEEWEFYGTDANTHNLDTMGDGSGLRVGLRSISGDISRNYCTNPSWDDYVENGSSQLTSLAGWTQNAGANLYTYLKANTTYYARSVPGETVNASLQFTGDEIVYQDLVDVAGANFDIDAPYLVDVAVAKVGSPTGTARIRLSGTVGSGGKTATVAHTSIAAATGNWTRLRLTLDSNAWPKQFNANNLKVQVSFESTGSIDATNYFLADDLLITPLTRVGDYGDGRSGRGSMGVYIGVIPGSTPFVKGDYFTASDTISGTRGTFQWATMMIANYGSLPYNSGGTETIADAS